jgi:hypothetical protein
VRVLVADVIDTLRMLRCADALRQRGSLLKTSGGYEIFIDQSSSELLFALRRGAEQLLLAALPVPIAAGEANVASSALNRGGNLRISFHRGAFAHPEVLQRAASDAACVVHDIQADVIDTFQPSAAQEQNGVQTAPRTDTLQILLEAVEDNSAARRRWREGWGWAARCW